MPFSRRRLCSEITLILSAGLLFAAGPPDAGAQTPQFTCRPNDAGDGWVCASTVPAPADTAGPADRSARSAAATPQTTPAAEAVAEPGPQVQPGVEPDSGTPPPVPAVTGSAFVRPLSLYDLDWMPVQDMSENQRAAIPGNCCGAFVDPSAGVVDPRADPAAAPTLFRTDGGPSQLGQNLITIEGDVIVQQGYRTVENDELTRIDRAANTVQMEGNVQFREPGLLLLGSSAYIDSDENSNRVEDAQYVLHEYGAHGSAASIVYNSDTGLVSIENGEFSRCEPGSNFWRLQADSIVLDQNRNRGYADNVSLRLGNFPIFYSPFTLTFPLGEERVSGFLAPSTGSTRSGGFDFELPYYFNLAPHYDATLSPRLISDRGVLVGLEARYLASWSMNTLNIAGLGDDKLYDEATVNIPGSDSPTVPDRWFLGYEHFGLIGDNFSTFVDYNAVSDEDYFYDLGSSGLNVTSRTHLNRQGRLDFNSSLLRAGVNVQRIQIIDPFLPQDSIAKPFDRLPQFFAESDAWLPGGFHVGIRGEFTAFDRDLDEALLSQAQLEDGALVTGERINLTPELGWSLESPGWFLRADARLKHVQYELENHALGTLEDPDFNVPVYSLDAGLVFERDMGRANGWVQTLEPRLYYLYSEFEDQSALPLFDTSELNFSFNQLFRDDRFSGGDRIGDADQATVALTSRLLNPAGQERARFSLGQIRYFEDRLVGLSNPLQTWTPRYSPLSDKSSLAGEIALQFGERWRVNADLQWNEDDQEIEEGAFQLRYQRDADHLFNLSYRYRSLADSPFFILPPEVDPRIKQTDLSGIWPLNENWKLLARWNYDHSNSRNLESFAGIEWSNCCATIRVIGREWVDEDELFLPNIEPNRGIFVQFTLNGLGNLTGGGLSNLLSDGIYGFRDTDYEQ